jgi:lipopolysaccharide transport system permease protein
VGAASTDTPQGSQAPAVTEITPVSGWRLPNFGEVARNSDLVYFLAKRDVTVRYKQTAVGALWAVIQPLMLAAIFTIFLGQLTDIPSGGTPYALFALTGMTMWLFLSGAISRSAESTLGSRDLISKVYFPRLIVPLAAVAAPAADFVVAFAVLIVILLGTGEVPGPQVLLAPPVFGLALAVALGIGLWLSALVVRYRDISLAVPFVTQVLLFVTPILYPLSLVPEEYRTLYALNPLVGLLETFRWTVLPHADAPGLPLLVSAATGALLLGGGLMFFGRAERRFADVI